MMRIIACLWLLCLLLPIAAYADDGARRVLPLNRGWEFAYAGAETAMPADARAWQRIDLPHTWNAKDMQSGPDFRAGTGWYRKTLHLDRALQDKRLYLRFEGVGQVAEVWVNDRLVGRHLGSYSAFCFEITAAAKPGAGNVIRVRVNNQARPDVLPVNHQLFGIYGGIYRPVALLVTDRINITPTDAASPGIYIRQDQVDAAAARISVTAKLQSALDLPQDAMLRILVRDREQRVVASTDTPVRIPPGPVTRATSSLRIERPHLWQGRRDPYLYTLTAELHADGRRLDAVSQPLGLRSYRVDTERGFLLNGQPYRLYGVNRHQDWFDHGNALSNAQHQSDLDQIADIGATAIRLAHYQQAEYVYAAADRMGFVAWAEIPFVNAYTGQESANAKQQMLELIRQNYNHPSIFFWGLHNEVTPKPDDADAVLGAVQLTRELHDLAKGEDPDRYTVAVSNIWWLLDNPIHRIADLQSFNQYAGWYGGKATELESWIRDTRKAHPGWSFAISEYGAEANIAQQSETLADSIDPVGQWFPENYQTWLHEVQWTAIAKQPSVWASFVWNMFDFAVPMWNRGNVPARNMKGLVSYDRKTRKDAFYWYQANWSPQPVLHIVGKRLSTRTRAEITVNVYSNLDDLELWLNGVKLGAPTPGLTHAQHLWPGVVLRPGLNRLKAVAVRAGKRHEDTAEWMLRTEPAAGSQQRLGETK